MCKTKSAAVASFSAAVLSVYVLAAAAKDTCIDLNDGWSGEMKSEKGLVLRREAILIPHNWDDYFGMRGFRHGNLHGTATYRRSFRAPPLAGRRSFLVFDGVGTYLTVRLNGKTLCERRPAGRLVTTVETTAAAKDGVNELEVVCDHPSEIQDMPWHCGGCSGIGSEGPEPFGLFRKVRLQDGVCRDRGHGRRGGRQSRAEGALRRAWNRRCGEDRRTAIRRRNEQDVFRDPQRGALVD